MAKMTNTDQQNITQISKDQPTLTLLKTTGDKSCDPEGHAVPAPHVAPVLLLLLQTGEKS
jgi:hypothetical protein